jgi:hypothetical protein
MPLENNDTGIAAAPQVPESLSNLVEVQKQEVQMKKLVLVALLITGLTQSGCEFLAGTLVGGGAAGGGYEYQAYRQMQQLEEDYKNRRISREEYEDRKKQIEKGSIIY